jgi:RND family efflux transporter MFP subunit
MSKLKLSPIRLALGVLLPLSLLACTESSNSSAVEESVTPRQAVTIRATTVQGQQGEQWLYFAGVARARERASLSFQVGGIIASRTAQIGQLVTANEVLATLYNPQLGPAEQGAQARLLQLRADAEQSERDLTRLMQLSERGLLADQRLEQQRSLIEGQEAAIASASAALAQSRQLNQESALRAPFAGRIEAVVLEAGEYAQPGQVVLQMTGASETEVEVGVPPHLLVALEVGQSIPVRHSLSARELVGVITQAGEASSGAKALYPLVVRIGDSSIRGGEALEVGIPRVADNSLSVPLNAVMRSAAGLTVFRVEGDRARRVPVEIDQVLGQQAVLKGTSLSAGDQIVYAGLSRLADGDLVEVLP